MVSSEPPITESEKRDALQNALTSDTFARSTQLRALLQYICEREMTGQSAELTEYQIAVDVLGRRRDFNVADDSSVRNRVYELRQRLEKYYTAENPSAAVQIRIPRGIYVPEYTRREVLPAEIPHNLTVELKPAAMPVPARRRYRAVAWIAAFCLLIGAAAGWYVARPRPAAALKEAWGPLAQSDDELLICVATSLHMIVRPHIGEHPWRLPAPAGIEQIYGAQRPLPPGTPLYMEPAQLSVPLAELAAVATLTSTRTSFGGAWQVLPESEAPVAALRGRNAILIATSTHSQAARTLLRNLPLTIDYDSDGRFALLDQRKPPGQNEIKVDQPIGQPVLSTLYGLVSVLSSSDSSGRPRRTVIISGVGSAGVQGAAEFFSSAAHMRDLKERMHGFPPAYQVVVRCKTSGLRLISYEYGSHEVGYLQ